MSKSQTVAAENRGLRGFSPILLRIVFIACLGLGFAQCAFASALAWDRSVQELGADPGQQEVKTFFTFHNKGDRPVKITSVTTSCGCTTGALAKDTYAPGESGQLSVVFAVGDRTGAQEKTLTVVTDELNGQSTELLLKVNVREYVTLTPRWAVWKRGEEASEKVITCTASSAQSFTLANVHSTNPHFSTRVDVVDPGKKYLIRLKPNATTEPESALIEVRLDIAQVGTRVLNIYGFVK